MRNDLIAYKGAWLYPVSDGTWEGNLRGFHYSADTLDELKAKIDMYNDENELAFKLATSKDYAKPIYGNDQLMEDEEEDIIQWDVQYQLKSADEYDDDIDGNNIREVIIEADDFDTAVKYAEQYARKSAHEDSSWADAEIISITQR